MSTIPRQKLLALLAQFNISPAAFDALRADAYEKHLAARSLTELEQFYHTLFDPALTYRQMRALAPPWGIKKYGGHRPSIETLREIRQRLRLEQHLHHLAATSGLLDSLKNAAPGQPDEQRAELLSAAVAMLSQELLLAKLEGKPIMENLRVVDQLLRVESLRVRQSRRTPPIEPVPAQPAKTPKDQPPKRKPEKPVARSQAQPVQPTPPAKPEASHTKENRGKHQAGSTGPNRNSNESHKILNISIIERNHTPPTPPANPALSPLVNLSHVKTG